MPVGPGKYDDLATYVRDQTDAQAVLLLVLAGDKGDGFSVQAPIELMVTLPQALRDLANNVEAEIQGYMSGGPN